ncbi:MAG: N-acetyltransferase [Pseudomonadota bacterium]
MIGILGKILGSKRKHVVQLATSDDLPNLAEIHRESFTRGWSDGEFQTLLSSDPYFCLVSRVPGNVSLQSISGFVLVKKVLDEAEIISIATSPKMRRNGLGRQLMDAAVRQLVADRVKSLYLEVDRENGAAVHLYSRMGFKKVGTREGYYPGNPAQGDKPSAALVMKLELG